MTRRAALTAAVAAPVALRAGAAGAAATGDAAVLTPVLRLERFVQASYAAATLSGSTRVRELATRFKRHEDQHVAALETSLEALGAPRIGPLHGAPALDAAARALGIAPVFSELHDADGLLAFLIAGEEALLAGWVTAHKSLSDANLMQTATQIMGSQGAHLVQLRRALGREPLPDAFDGST